MRNNLSAIFIPFIIALLVIGSLSCNKSNPVESGKVQLTASESPVSIAIFSSKSITISGGQGSCSVKSLSDTTIITVSVDRYSAPVGRTLILQSKALGTAKLVIQDSARTAEVEIIVTVATMIATPSSATVQVGRSQTVYLQGGAFPYVIEQPANSSVATVTVSGSYVYINGVSAGSTAIVVKDNSTPPNKVSVAITVTPKPVLTTPGTISFSSSVGDFSVNGILPEDIVPQPANSEGAGGTVFISAYQANFGEIVGYRKHTQNIVDVVAIVFMKSTIAPGSVAIDSSRSLTGRDTSFVEFVFGGDLNSPTADTYLLHSGILTFSSLSQQNAIGSFSGAATLLTNNLPVPGNTSTVTNGTFNVPLLLEDFGIGTLNSEQQQVLKFAQKMLEAKLRKMKLNSAK